MAVRKALPHVNLPCSLRAVSGLTTLPVVCAGALVYKGEGGLLVDSSQFVSNRVELQSRIVLIDVTVRVFAGAAGVYLNEGNNDTPDQVLAIWKIVRNHLASTCDHTICAHQKTAAAAANATTCNAAAAAACFSGRGNARSHVWGSP